VAVLLSAAGLFAQCSGTLYLTVDTGTMSQAELIANTLRKRKVKATFFLANEKTYRGDWTLDDSWSGYWQSLVRDGHAFGTHTWRHGYFRSDDGPRVRYVLNGKPELLDQAAVCRELDRVNERFRTIAGRPLDAFWRAPGGAVTPNVLRMATECGYRSVGWSKAGLLGDELPSAAFPNSLLIARAEKNLKDGDILLMHTGIRSRKDPFAPALDELLTRLQRKGFCFATITPEAAKRFPRGSY
jgi:peptidoglycan/xylan/chitin deacetylase (PgdA/CDA1 family)